MKDHYFFFGFGQVAKYFVRHLLIKKKIFSFTATSTSKSKYKSLYNKRYLSLKLKNNKFDKNIKKKLKKSNYILISIPPNKNKDCVLSNFKKNLMQNKNQKIIYLSSTSVYGNHNGSWVNENSRCRPTSIFGKRRLYVENAWAELMKKGLDISIFRLSGIYSRESNSIKRLRFGSLVYVKKKNHFFSRIRVEDIANAIFKRFENKSFIGGVFNISDNLPASSEKVTRFAAKLLNIKKLSFISYNNLNGMMRSFYKDSKKVSNAKMKKILKVKLKFPTYKEGLRNIRYKKI